MFLLLSELDLYNVYKCCSIEVSPCRGWLHAHCSMVKVSLLDNHLRFSIDCYYLPVSLQPTPGFNGTNHHSSFREQF